jgi:hypothetical protein
VRVGVGGWGYLAEHVRKLGVKVEGERVVALHETREGGGGVGRAEV